MKSLSSPIPTDHIPATCCCSVTVASAVHPRRQRSTCCCPSRDLGRGGGEPVWTGYGGVNPATWAALSIWDAVVVLGMRKGASPTTGRWSDSAESDAFKIHS
jgi:hypothetical protein